MRSSAEQAAVYDEWLSKLHDTYADRIVPVTAEVAQEWGRLNVPDPLPVIDGLLATLPRGATHEWPRTGWGR